MRSIYFHEDDYCQIEILPVENLFFCMQQTKMSTQYSQTHQEQYGWNDIYIRKQKPIALHKKSLTVKQIETALIKVLPSYDAVYTGYSANRSLMPNAGAFGRSEDVAMFYDYQEQEQVGIVNNIWLVLDVYTKEDFWDAHAVLNALSKLENLLIADWNWSCVYSLLDTPTINQYLLERLEDFS